MILQAPTGLPPFWIGKKLAVGRKKTGKGLNFNHEALANPFENPLIKPENVSPDIRRLKALLRD